MHITRARSLTVVAPFVFWAVVAGLVDAQAPAGSGAPATLPMAHVSGGQATAAGPAKPQAPTTKKAPARPGRGRQLDATVDGDLDAAPPGSPAHVETLRATGGLPAHLVGEFREPLGFTQVASGEYLVFDRRGHTVYGVDAARTAARPLVSIGGELGRVLEPTAFSAAPDGRFMVADAPNGRERIQGFDVGGPRLGGFYLPGRPTPRVSVGSLVLNGIGTMFFTGTTLLLNQPETGSLIVEYDLLGNPFRTVGRLRDTGHEEDRELHLALNTGIPLAAHDGGYWFVFIAGTPEIFRFDAHGLLVFRRAIQGRELDAVLAAQPTIWPRRQVNGTEVPLVVPVIRTAAVAPGGEVWVSLMVPFTYVYDPFGEKRRTVRFQAAGSVAPSSLSFAGTDRILVTPGCFEFPAR